MMDWRKLLSTARPGEDDGSAQGHAEGPARTAFQKDWDRVVFSSAFRRLQDKTQVHAMPESDYVRTRLTHSLEVSSVGRTLGAAVGQVVMQRHAGLDAVATPADFGHIVAAAALAHDIGNPPFGHFGEETIRFWFADAGGGRRALEPLSAAERADFLGFEGNAQGFRILTRLQNWRDQGGLRLTAATLGAFSKYPRPSRIAPPPVPVPASVPDCASAKIGFFQAEKDLFAGIAETLGLIARDGVLPEGDQSRAWCRHPLAFLVEAADDICYQIVDLEDGYKLGRIQFAEAESLLVAVIGGTPPRYASVAEAPRRISYLRGHAIGSLTDAVVQVFLDREAEIMAGNLTQNLLSQTSAQSTLREIAALTDARVFSTRSRYEVELGGVEIMTTLLEAFVAGVEEVAAAKAGGGRLSPRARTLARILPEPLQLDPPYLRLLQVTDFVSGMTDTYALTQYRRLRGGIRL